jgi:hypothetical protein
MFVALGDEPDPRHLLSYRLSERNFLGLSAGLHSRLEDQWEVKEQIGEGG